jgi:hypothetical protein
MKEIQIVCFQAFGPQWSKKEFLYLNTTSTTFGPLQRDFYYYVILWKKIVHKSKSEL